MPPRSARAAAPQAPPPAGAAGPGELSLRPASPEAAATAVYTYSTAVVARRWIAAWRAIGASPSANSLRSTSFGWLSLLFLEIATFASPRRAAVRAPAVSLSRSQSALALISPGSAERAQTRPRRAPRPRRARRPTTTAARRLTAASRGRGCSCCSAGSRPGSRAGGRAWRAPATRMSADLAAAARARAAPRRRAVG